ncbi:peroxidase 29-like [Syzygium oleosum]|uniref:peroxidase 29-like n=1 Tax=Syzygium oleosum TaxID=219896 RepID=UPI0024BA8B6B|nr:peroxidase 29-like [Syzygium oleosum]
MGRSQCMAIAALLMVVWVGVSDGQLAYDYYRTTCPNAEDIVRREMLSFAFLDATAPAACLRLMFHDCQVQGCDASILLDPIGLKSEMKSSRNFGIRKLEAIEHVKAALEAECPGQVSCADIIALAARESVALSGGPHIAIPLGRKDSRASNHQQADAHLPSPSISVDAFLQTFMAKGLNLEESVAIVGAHTLGTGHCLNIVDRLHNLKPDDQMNPVFEAQLRLQCPTSVPLTNLTTVSNDITPTIFDNQYYRDLLLGKGLFLIDSSISTDPRTSDMVRQFAIDLDYFFRAFSSAFVKLSSTNVLGKMKGEVRKHCSRAN